jgi:hypothetical protein
MNEVRKKPGVAFWATVVVVCLMLYVLSAPPLQHRILPVDSPPWIWDSFEAIYRPLRWLIEVSPEPVQKAILRYAALWH